MNETRAAKARLSAVAGRLTLVGTGLGALTLIAISAQMLMETPANRTAVAALTAARAPAEQRGAVTQALAAITRSPAPQTADTAPQIWMASATLTDAPFAADGYAHGGVLPRGRIIAPAGAPASEAEPPVVAAPVAPEGYSAPRFAIPAEPHPAPRMARAETEHPVFASLPRAEAEAESTSAPALQLAPEGTAPLGSLVLRVPEARPEATEEGPSLATLALRAPRRSLRPQPRPEALVAEPEIPVSPAAPLADAERAMLATLEDGGLIRSRTPQPRPEAVTRLASLALDTPATITDAAPAQPAARVVPAALEIPALTGRSNDSCSDRLTRAIPRRPGRAAEGSTVVSHLGNAGGSERDGAVIGEVLQGNIPDFLRNLVPVTFTGSVNGQQTRVTICVMPDYLAVGSNRDFVRVPLGLPAAMRVAERFDMVLPTTTMVDAIYQQAQVRLSPSPMDPTSAMSTTGYFMRHNTTVQGQLSQAGGRLGQLVSGHKKDLVLTNRLQSNPGRVAIYGWHQRNGRAIQPLSTVHGAQYADYSHGIRLVSRTAYVNGRAVDLRDLLSDSRTAGLVSSEGTITNRQLLALAE
ncbi:hypothetical protein [Pararhodobacter sp. CCB-MM2]|uniref:hypothetical protein n=1 Tax=Pararhodobacter sp. CCB-MM2 TaxID=1786003 RepID=UPI000B21168E|nr:hypothetical protein [Pararhodobacter sp. CCB-MM2]